MEAVKWPQRASGPVNFTPAASDLLAWELLQTLCLSAWWEASLLQELWSGKRLPTRRGGWEIFASAPEWRESSGSPLLDTVQNPG